MIRVEGDFTSSSFASGSMFKQVLIIIPTTFDPLTANNLPVAGRMLFVYESMKGFVI